MRFALAGNPNCGKTTIYNAVTGRNEIVGNWAGVTVEEQEFKLKNKYKKQSDEEIFVVDLPGAYSISPYTNEESLTKDFIMNEKLDVIINIIDGANITRSLFFTTQLLELNIPMVLVINKKDIIDKRGDKIDIELLSKKLNCKIFFTNGKDNKGLEDVFFYAYELAKTNLERDSLEIKDISDSDNKDLARQKFISDITSQTITKNTVSHKSNISDKIDEIVAHKWFGIGIFFFIMYIVFWLSQVAIGGFASDYINEILFGEIIPNNAESLLHTLGVNEFFTSLILEGIIAGVGAVLGFLPLIMVLFFLLGLLEDCGYMARVAVVMDRFFKKIGLSGKSIIPMIVGTGCSVPGIMSTRTIENPNERKITAILTPFVPCSAKLPIIALFAGVFFPGKAWVGPTMYMIAIFMIVVGGLILQKIFVWDEIDESKLIIELPEYKLPSLRYATNKMLTNAKFFIIKASTIILTMNTLIWFLQSHTFGLEMVTDPSDSMLAFIGGILSVFLIPLGFKGWELAAATLTGFVAKEEVVATLAVILASSSEEALSTTGGVLTQYFTPVTALSFIMLNLFIPPCFAAIGAMNNELGSKKLLFKALAFQITIGYTLAMITSQVGSLILYGEPSSGFISSIFVLIGVIVTIVLSIKKSNEHRNKEGLLS